MDYLQDLQILINFFYRIGLKNDANQLNSGTFNSNGRKISSIKIKYGRL